MEKQKIDSLTPVERLHLANQYTILEKIDPDNAEDYAEKREIITKGYTIRYEEVFRGVHDETSLEECEYVYQVLELYDLLARSYELLDDKDGLTLEDVRFKGFDGNNETGRWAFAEHLKKYRKWEAVLLEADVDSHSMTTMSRYPRMLARYKPIHDAILKSQTGRWILSAKQIREIIS